MRPIRQLQPSLFDSIVDHDLVEELNRISALLDRVPECVEWVAEDVCTGQTNRGPDGIPAESTLRIGLIMHRWNLSYERMAFHLCDSSSLRAFTRLPWQAMPKKAVIHKLVSRIRPETWKRINDRLVRLAAECGVERGRKVRIDSTVSETHIESPTDSKLLGAAIRVMLRLLQQGRQWTSSPYTDCHRAATRRMMEIQYGRGRAKRENSYRQLLRLTHRSLNALQHMAQQVPSIELGWHAQVEHFKPLIEKVIDQTERRVIQGESVPASEKLVSLFEPHTDIIKKGGRDTHYGHKINLVTGASALILDIVVEQGNPADSTRLIPMIERQTQLYNRPPRQIAADGCYASRQNLAKAKTLGVEDVVFNKRHGIKIEDMARNPRVYQRLRKFRCNVEAQIGNLKNLFGVKRINRHGFDRFCAYVMSATVAYNLTALAAFLPTP